MGFIDKIFTPSEWGSTRIQEAASAVAPTSALTNELLVERIHMLESSLDSLRLEDYMWSPIAGWRTDDGFSLGTIQDEADTCRSIYAINPLIKKAVLARTGMIHGRGVRILTPGDANNTAVETEVERQNRRLFGPVARARLEAELSTSGNVWVVREQGKEAVTAPIAQIKGYISDVHDPTVITYWRRSYQAQQTNMESGQSETIIVDEYIPTSRAVNIPQSIGDTPVRRQARMVHIAANRQEGWVLGLPDVFAAKFWTKGHKEMFEAGHEFALAQGQYAMKVTGGSGPGTQLAASRLADEPIRDYETGEYGATFLSSGNTDIQMLGKMGSGVDFKSYDRIAGLIASATGVPLAVLLSESSKDEISLEASVVEDMKLRQELWSEFYQDYFGTQKITVVWPRIKQETLYRTVQSVEVSNRTNTLSQKEKRLVSLEAYGLDGDPNALPDISEHPDVLVYEAKKKLDLEYAPLIAAASVVETEDEDTGRSTTPDQGNDQGIGKLSDGDDAHDARDNGEQEHTRR